MPADDARPDASLAAELRELAQVHRHRAALRTHRDTKAEHRRTAMALEQAATRLEALEAENARLRESIEDVERLHAQHIAEGTVTDDRAYEDCDEATMEARHHAATCALAHALWILGNSREQRERLRRELFARLDAGGSEGEERDE